MGLRRRVSQDTAERYAADQQLAAGYDDRLARADEADRALRLAQRERNLEGDELRALTIGLDRVLTEALLAAEAAERVAMGVRTYPPADGSPDEVRTAEIARRKAKARGTVRPWTAEIDRLRTARERHRLGFRAGRTLTAPS